LDTLKIKNDSKEANRIKVSILKLNKDCLIQEKKVKIILNFSKRHKRAWFKETLNPGINSRAIFFKCIIPRCCISDIEAKYCFHFILFMINGSAFNLLSFVWEIIQSLYLLICSFTTAETRRFGKFFLELLIFLESRKKNQQTFDSFFPNLSMEILDIGYLVEIKNCNFSSVLRVFRQVITYHLVSNIISRNEQRQKNSIVFLHQLINQYPRLKINHTRLIRAIKSLTINPKSSTEILSRRVMVILDERFNRYTVKK